jgi:hypothetical protein
MPAALLLTTDADATEGRRARRRRRRAPALAIAVAATGVEWLALRRRGYRSVRNVIVRCRAGHLFTTIWIPGASVKSLRLGLWRLQRCPVGVHWSIVTPVDEASLSDEQRSAALEHHDVRLP